MKRQTILGLSFHATALHSGGSAPPAVTTRPIQRLPLLPGTRPYSIQLAKPGPIDVTCTTQNFNTGGGIVWLPSGVRGTGPVLPAPAILAQQAVQQLPFPGLTIDASPSTASDQLVGLPTWLWLDPIKWHPITATAAVPGESITATATPMAVTWDLGDGNSMTCQGPGTPYLAAKSPDEPSPTCGYTCSTSSADQPYSAFIVTATVLWSVAWVGGGQTGTVPAMSSTTTTKLRVADVESLNTAGRGV